MLISFTVQNYRSFADEQTLSLEAVKDDAHPDHVVNHGKFLLLKSIAIYGSNASGKSNLLKAFDFMVGFIRNSATGMNLGDQISGANYFRLDKTRSGMPCPFDIRVLLNETEYQYGFSVRKERVYDEWLYVTRKGTRSTNPLSRRFDPETEKTDWKLRGELKGSRDLIEKTRDNGLFLSRAAEMNTDCVKELFLWLKDQIRYLCLVEPPAVLVQETAKRVENDNVFRARIEKLVHDADLGVEGLSVERKPLAHILRDAPREVLRVAEPFIANLMALGGPQAAREASRAYVALHTRHRLPNSEDTMVFSLEDDESVGTQRFFGLIGPILDALDRGDLLIIDELDCSMHPQLTRKLVEMFDSEEANPKGAQLIFTTHDTNLMTPSLFRRDQIWLTEKTRNGNTELFSLTDIESEKRPRKDEPFEKNYLAGRYGGVPSFGPALEDFGVQ